MINGEKIRTIRGPFEEPALMVASLAGNIFDHSGSQFVLFRIVATVLTEIF